MDDPLSSPAPGGSVQGILVRDRPRQSQHANHVTWDEEAIAEHDKERGTRQKIDEPDTPFIRSPQEASDDEAKPQSSDDEHRLSVREPVRLSLLPGYEGAFQSPGCVSKPTESDVNVEVLAHRLDALMRGKGRRGSNSSSEGGEGNDQSKNSSTCSSRSSSSATVRRPGVSNDRGSQRVERRISIEENLQPPKPTTSDFAKKRSQHYNEGKAMKAFKQRRPGDGSSTESERSDDSDAADLITINTNTNINTTSLQAAVCRPRLPSNSCEGDSDHSKDEPKRPIGARRGSGDSAGSQGSRSAKVSVVSPTSPSLATSSQTRGAGEEASWKAKRDAHYNKMAAAFKAAPPPSDDEDEDSDDGQ